MTSQNTGLKYLLFFESTPSKSLGPLVASSAFVASAFGGQAGRIVVEGKDENSGKEEDGLLAIAASDGEYVVVCCCLNKVVKRR